MDFRSLKAAKRDAWSSRQKNSMNYICYTSLSKGFCCYPNKKLYSLRHNFCHFKIKCQLKITDLLVWLSVEWREGKESSLMFKKKILPLITELVVVLNHLGVKHLSCSWFPITSICKKLRIDLLFKNKKYLQTRENF